MIKVNGACKTLGENDVLKDINLSVEKGSIFGLIGPNGAGKSTLIKAITGIWRLDKGAIMLDGQEVFDNPAVKETMGYVPDQCHYYSSFRVKEITKFYRLTYKSFNMHRYEELNKTFQIPEGRYIRELSKGMKTRLAIMLNLSIMPKVLILDEPTSGLDPIVKRETLNILLDDVAERGTTLFISSHNLSDLERICDSVAIINKGEIKYANSIESMKKNIRKLQVAFKEDAPHDLKAWKEVLDVAKLGRVYNIITKEYTGEFEMKLEAGGAVFIEEIDLSLEDMFIYAVGGGSFGEIFKQSAAL